MSPYFGSSGAGEGLQGAPEPIHVRRSQHWTHCSRKVRKVSAVVSPSEAAEMVQRAKGRPPILCRTCWQRWREDPSRRR